MTTRPPVPPAAASRVLVDTRPNEYRRSSFRDLYRLAAAHRSGGDLFTRRVNDPLGSWAAAVAIRFGLHPTIVTGINLTIALGAGGVIIARAEQLHAGWFPGLLALLCWQLSFILDCADGQVARATGKATSFGARLDTLVDLLVHGVVICSLATVVAAQSDLPSAILVGLGIFWPVNLLVYALARADGNIGHSFTRREGIVAVIKLGRDTGFVLLVVGIWLFVHPESIVFPIMAFAAFNACLLLANIAREAYLSMRQTSVFPHPEEEA